MKPLSILTIILALSLSALTSPCLAQGKEAHAAGFTSDNKIERAQKLFFSDQYEEAEKIFRESLAASPDDAEIMAWLAQTLAYKMGEQAKRGASKLSLISDGAELKSLYTKAYKLDPTNERAQLGYAILLRDLPGLLGGDLDQAENILSDLIEANPEKVLAYHHLGNLYIRKKEDYQKGLHFLKRALTVAKEKELTDEEAYYLNHTYHSIGKTYLEELDEPKQALDYITKALELKPEFPLAMLDLTETYRQLDQIENAKSELFKAVAYCKEHKYKMYYSDIKKSARQLNVSKDIDL
ncbi:MAG: tetratricopeptide repeat protein [Candidatus Hinthialibacter antarcticus]|nr:tetratricopeptide repeat protein [Candidatus Hinthialibacter antarcticus]